MTMTIFYLRALGGLRTVFARKAVVGALLAGAWGAALACPGDGGPTCSIQTPAPASQRAAASVNVGVGNPINILTGNKYQREEDMAPLPGVLGLEIVRHYNSRFSGSGDVPGLVGRGWKLSYETLLVASGPMIQVFQADGTSFMFSRDLVNPALATGVDPASGKITIRRQRNGGEEYLWRWVDGRELSFDRHGRLQQIKAATGEAVSLLYDPKGLLVKVTDPQGRSLRIAYPDRKTAGRGDRFRGIQSIDSPLGRFSYEHGSISPAGRAAGAQRQLLANLVRVRYPATGQGREYYYEDARRPTLLTGIGIVNGADAAGRAQKVQRHATYAYDDAGRGVLSTHANGVGKVTLSFDKPGQTTVVNSLGQQTLFRYATVGEDLRLLEARGPGCSLCGPGNVRYGYDKLGRLTETTRTDETGFPVTTTRSELDYYGRPVSVSRIEYRAGKALPAQLLARYEYAQGAMVRPTAVIRPSVVPGKEAVTRIAYNERLQVSSITENGWSPALDGRGPAQALMRTTRFGYRVVGGRTVLATIDGPLANGPLGRPGDSDITEFDYDAGGNYVVKKVEPGNRVTRIDKMTGAGQPLRLVDGYGMPMEYSYDAAGRVARLARAGVATHFAYNALGKVSGITEATGQRMAFAYGGDGRLSDVSDAQGNRIRIQRDTEGNLIARELLNPDGSVAQSSDLSRYISDPEAPPNDTAANRGGETLTDPNGNATSIERDAEGMPRGVMEPGGIATRFAYDSLQRVTQVTDPRALRTGYVYDDFGRLVRLDSPDAGTTVFTWNDDDTLRSKTLAYGSRQARAVTYRYDVAGRVIGQTAAEGTTSLSYGPQGKPARIVFPGGEELYEYNAAAQLTLHTRVLDGTRFSTRYEYDSRGQLVRKTLPDGQILNYRYNNPLHAKAGLLATITRKGLLGETVLLSGLNDAEDAFGKQDYKLAHGVDFTRWLDREGHVTRIGSPGFWEEKQQVDAVGQIVQRTSSGAAGVRATQYGYDPLGRLRAATLRDVGGKQLPASIGYDYDISGNVLEQAGTTPLSYRIDAFSNRILSAQGRDGRVDYEYDAAGSTTRIGGSTFEWDSQARLVKVSKGGEPLAEYSYNTFGERIKKVVYSKNQKKVTYFLYDGNQLVAEAQPDEGGISIKRQYVWLEDHTGVRPIAMLQAKEGGPRAMAGAALSRLPVELARAVGQAERTDVYAVVADHTGAARALVDAARRVAWSADIGGYGRAQVRAGSTLELQLRGSQQYFDDETGLHYNARRYLDADSGRYLSADPSGQAGGINLYAYADGNPVANIDPLGLQAKPAGPVSGWSFADKLKYVVEAALPKMPGDLATALKEMVSPANIATTAAVFSLWLGSHAFGVGAIFDGVMLGVAYYTMGTAAIDVIMGLIDTAMKINDAKCEGDLQGAAGTLSKAVTTGATGFIEGALIRKIFQKSTSDIGTSMLDTLKRAVNQGKNRTVHATSALARLGFRAKSWAAIMDNHERGFIGELDAWSYLISGKKKLQIMGTKTIDPREVRTQADYDSELAAYRGTKGVDGAFEERPGFFKMLIGEKPTYYVVESKATGGGKNPTNSLLETLTGGTQQMSDNWLFSAGPKGSRVQQSVGNQGRDELLAASAEGRLKKVLAYTNQSGTRYFEINDAGAGKVTIGADISHLFK
jgi:RHS repeat-associated protein